VIRYANCATNLQTENAAILKHNNAVYHKINDIAVSGVGVSIFQRLIKSVIAEVNN